MRPLADADANKGLQPQRLQSYKRTHYYQLPPGGAKAAKGLVVFLHGCAREARAFFPQDPKRCKECVGELTEVLGVLPARADHAVSRGREQPRPLPACAGAGRPAGAYPCHCLTLRALMLPAGLPEHLSHTKQALAAGYAVLALDPHDSKHDCWSSTDRNGHRNDQPLVSSASSYWLGAAELSIPGW